LEEIPCFLKPEGDLGIFALKNKSIDDPFALINWEHQSSFVDVY
jgi:hypothetical protein